ncbi:MAG: hypothetical protein VXY93_12520, partial [Pseudomonadota bacterium]|nr:hypothetical protein [Pseudomonadota bacterium]
DHERPLFVVGIVSDRTFEVQAGPSTIPHIYQGGGHAYEFYNDLTHGSGYRGPTVAIGVTDQAYEHRFVKSGIGSIRKGNFAGDAFTATNAVYTSHTGTLLLTIPNHGLTTSDTVGIDTGGLVFKCSKDNFFSDHPYPRSTDPASGKTLEIMAFTTNTITLDVGLGGGVDAVITASITEGVVTSVTIVNPGTGYTNTGISTGLNFVTAEPPSPYKDIPLFGGSGSGATMDVVVGTGGSIVSFDMSNRG